MATDTYKGPQGGDWFDPANWTGAVPREGDVVDLFGQASADARSGGVSGEVIDVSGTIPGALYYDQMTQSYLDFTPNLFADTLGTASAPVAIEATGDGGAPSRSGIVFGTLNGSIDVAAGQTLAVSDTSADYVTINGNVTVAKGAALSFDEVSAFGYSDPVSLTMNGVLFDDGGTVTLQDHTTDGNGRIEIADGGIVKQGSVGPAESFNLATMFDPTGGTLDISNIMGSYNGTIGGFGAGDTIVEYDQSRGEYGVTDSFANGVLTINGYAFTETLRFAGAYTTANFKLTQVAGGIDVTWQPCFATGTMIATGRGTVAVEDLVSGDQVVLATGGSARVVWLGHRRQLDGHVIRVMTHALGPHQPVRDLFVSEDHGLFLDGVLIQAGLLVNGETIVRERRDRVIFWHVELDRHGILLAENASAESYVDTGNRRQFGNCPLGYDPVEATQEMCAEMVFAGTRLEAIRRRLAIAPA